MSKTGTSAIPARFLPRIRYLASKVQEGKVILFVGAGVSQEAGLRGGWELAQSLAAEIDYLPQPGDTLGTVSEYYENEFPGELVDLLVEWFEKGAKPGPSHLLIPSIDWAAIYTTNYDQLIERGYEEAGKPYHRVVYNAMLQDSQTDETPIIKLHGCLSLAHRRSDQAPIVITDADYERYTGREALINKLKQSLFDGYSLLFLGYGLQDSFWKDLRFEVASVLAGHSRSYYAVMPTFTEQWEKYWRSRNVFLIPATAHQLLQSL